MAASFATSVSRASLPDRNPAILTSYLATLTLIVLAVGSREYTKENDEVNG